MEGKLYIQLPGNRILPTSTQFTSMYKFLLLLLLPFSLACNPSQKTSGAANAMNGTWVPVRQEIGGKALPGIVYEKQLLILDRNKYTLIAESVDKGETVTNGNKMDIYGKEGVNTGKHFTAIYKLENGELTICYNLAGTDYPEMFSTAGKPLFFLSVFKKQ